MPWSVAQQIYLIFIISSEIKSEIKLILKVKTVLEQVTVSNKLSYLGTKPIFLLIVKVHNIDGLLYFTQVLKTEFK